MIEKNKVVIKGFSLLISSLILCQTCATSALALGSSPIQRNVEYNESMQENVEDSTFTLANSNVQISDNYGDESAYISETQIFNEYNFEEMMPYNLEQIILHFNYRAMQNIFCVALIGK